MMGAEKSNEGRLTPEDAQEDIERVGKTLHDPRWWETWVKNQEDADAIFELARSCGYTDVKPGSAKKLEEFVKRLGEGMYIGPLESYVVPWNEQKVGRDLWQNFFDGNGYTLDGITAKVTSVEGMQGVVQIRIEGPGEYDFRKLLHFGGTSKEKDVRAAGGVGEGAKVAVFLLLRDHKVPVVKFASGDWELEYYFHELPEEQYDKPIRGLFVRLKKVPHRKGNFVEFKGRPGIAAAVEDARNLFYHSENPDFKNPTFKNEVGGFQCLGVGKKGRLYEAGQRRHYTDKERWDTVEGLTLWLNKKSGLPLERDRGAYLSYQIGPGFVEPFVQSMSKEEVEKSLRALKEFWYMPEQEGEIPHAALALLEKLLQRAKSMGIKLEFEKNAVAAGGRYGWLDSDRLLKNRGYVLYRFCFGMSRMIPTVLDTVTAFLKENYELTPSPEEEEAIELLQLFVENVRLKSERLDWVQPPLKLFGQNAEGTLLHGRYTAEGIWLAEEALYAGVHDALTTYIHELAHEASAEHDTNFSYTHTDYVRRVLEYIAQQPEEFFELAAKLKSLHEARKKRTEGPAKSRG